MCLQGGYSGIGNQPRSGNMQGVGNLAMSPPNIGGQGMRPQGSGLGVQMAGMEASLMTLQKQQQQQEALLRDTQLQMVNNLLLQQQSKRGQKSIKQWIKFTLFDKHFTTNNICIVGEKTKYYHKIVQCFNGNFLKCQHLA